MTRTYRRGDPRFDGRTAAVAYQFGRFSATYNCERSLIRRTEAQKRWEALTRYLDDGDGPWLGF